MLCACAREIAVRHSLFVVANSCCHSRHWTMRYENAGRWCPRPCRRHLLSSLPLLLTSPSRDTMYMPRALALRISSSTYVIVAAVTYSLCVCAQCLMDSSCACAWGLRRNIVCQCCQNKELVHLRTMTYCLHSHVLLSSNNNTHCKRKPARLCMRGLTPTYDDVAAPFLSLLLSPLPSRVGRCKITKRGLYE